jgi:DNA-binding response OmpR family regulator
MDAPQRHPSDPAAALALPHVLVVDDDPALCEMLAEFLGGQDLRVTAVPGGAAMRAALAAGLVDLVVLDLRLPGEDGLALARELRAAGNLPIVLLTGRSDEADRVAGLELGADDYVTKPFSPRELLARIRGLLRRTRPASAPSREDPRRAFRFEGWELNLRTRRLLAPDGRRLGLTNGEFSLLAALCGAPQRVLSRDQLLALSRLHAAEVYDRTIDVQILRLRRKIEADPSNPQFIVTERGAGYRFTPAVSTVY